MPNRKHSVLLIWLSSLLLAGWWLSTSLHLKADLSLFLPKGDSEMQQLLLNELHQGRATRLLLIGISGGDARRRADLSQGLVGALRESGLFERVENGTPSDIRFDSQLMRYRYLLTAPEQLAETLSEKGLRSALEARLAELQTPLPNPFKSLLPRDPTAAYATLLKAWQPQQRVASAAGVWASHQGDMAILLAMTHEGGLALDQQTQALALVKSSFDQLKPDTSYRMVLSGPGTFAILSKQLIESESRQLSLLASCAIALLLLLAYRFLPYLLYAALPLLSALLVASLVTSALFHNLHGITLAFGITLLGVTLDYPVHLFSHLTRAEHSGQTMRRIWPTLRLGVITTCLGYMVLVTTDFSGLQQLGVFTLAGLLTAALASRYLLPQLLQNTSLPPPRGRRMLSLLSQRHWIPASLMSVATALSAAALFASPHLWNDDIAVLSPLPASLLEQDRFLRQQLMTQESNQLLLLPGKDMQQLLDRCESLKPLLTQAVAEGLTAGAALPCDYLPSRQLQAATQRRIPPREVMAERLRRALEGLPFRAGAFDAFLDDLQSSRELTPLDYGATISNLLRDRLDPLLRPQDDGWLALIPLPRVRQGEVLAARLEKALPQVRYVNLRTQTSHMIGSFRQQILQRMALGIVVMLAVLWIGLRSPLHAIGILIPIAAAILTTLGLLLLRGESMNLFHLISLMLVLGIGIDFSLFFSRQNSAESERQRTLHALTLCALSTVSVFAILGSSTIPVLHAIGQTVAFGVSMSYLATYAFWYLPWNPLRDRS